MTREGLSEQRPEGSEGESHLDIGKRISGKEKGFKSLDAEGSVMCLSGVSEGGELGEKPRKVAVGQP